MMSHRYRPISLALLCRSKSVYGLTDFSLFRARRIFTGEPELRLIVIPCTELQWPDALSVRPHRRLGLTAKFHSLHRPMTQCLSRNWITKWMGMLNPTLRRFRNLWAQSHDFVVVNCYIITPSSYFCMYFVCYYSSCLSM
jgi:hypothetical protein